MFLINVIKCEDNKFYVYKSLSGIDIKSISTCTFTEKYKPLEIVETVQTNDGLDEDKIVKKYMSQYGIDNVRGGSYTHIRLESWQIQDLNHEIKHINTDQKNINDTMDNYLTKFTSLETIDDEIKKLTNLQYKINELREIWSLIDVICRVRGMGMTQDITNAINIITNNADVCNDFNMNPDALNIIKLTLDKYDYNEHDDCDQIQPYINCISVTLKNVFNAIEHEQALLPKSSYNIFLMALSYLLTKKIELKKIQDEYIDNKNINYLISALYEQKIKLLHIEYSK